MKKMMLAVVAATALCVPAVAQQSGNPQGQPGVTASQQQASSSGHEMSPHSLNSSQVEKIQKSLDGKGFKSGEVDGKWGPQTDAALKDFQKSQNMSHTGDLDGATIAGLGLIPSDFGLPGSKPETTGQAPAGGDKNVEHDPAPNGANGAKK